MNLKKVALFDFCETLVTIQSADKYIDFVRHRQPSLKQKVLEVVRIILVKALCFRLVSKLFPNNIWHKQLKLYQLKGISKNDLEALAKVYYEEVLKPHIIPEIIKEIVKKQKKHYKIIIVSGGYAIYIKYFAKDFGIDFCDVMATQIGFTLKGICKGTIEGLDCMKANKVKMLRSRMDMEQYNLESSYAYSDSLSDLPLLKFVGKGIVVTRKPQKWSKHNGLGEILWKH